jgi:hypothetical protein
MTELSAAWRAHRAYLVNLAYQMLGDIGEAEDVAQEAFLRLSRTDGIDDVRGWLTVVVRRPTSGAGSPSWRDGCASTSCGQHGPGWRRHCHPARTSQLDTMQLETVPPGTIPPIV